MCLYGHRISLGEYCFLRGDEGAGGEVGGIVPSSPKFFVSLFKNNVNELLVSKINNI